MIDTTSKVLYNDLEQFAEQTFNELGVALDERDPHVACLLQGFADIANTLKQELSRAQYAQKIALLNTMVPSLLLDVPPLSLLQINPVRQLQVIPAETSFKHEQSGQITHLKALRACQLLPIKHYQLKQQNEKLSLQIQFSEVVNLSEIRFALNNEHQSAATFLSLLHDSLDSIVLHYRDSSLQQLVDVSLSSHMSIEKSELSNLNAFYACPQQFLCFKLQWSAAEKISTNHLSIELKFSTMLNCLIDQDLLLFNSIPVRHSQSVAADPIILQAGVNTYPLPAPLQTMQLYQASEFKLIQNSQQKNIAYQLIRNEKGFFVQVDNRDFSSGDLLAWDAEIFSLQFPLQTAWRQAIFTASNRQLTGKLMCRPSRAYLLKRDDIYRITKVLAFLQRGKLNAKNMQQLLQCCSWVKPAAYYLKYLVKLKQQAQMRQIQGKLLPTQAWQLHFANYGEKKGIALQFFYFLRAFIHAYRPLNSTVLVEGVFHDD